MSAEPVNLVYFYSNKDRVVLEVESDLLKMQKANLISVWSEKNITGGKDIEAEISEKLEAAKIVLLFVSKSFDSEYYSSSAVARAIEKSQNNQLRLIPILVSPFITIEILPYYQLIINPDDPLDVESRHKRKDACDKASKEVMRAAKEIRGDLLTSPKSAGEQNRKTRTQLNKTEFPSFYFLTQFCDRTEQTEQLGAALQQRCDKLQKRGGQAVPLVCFVHGDVAENVEGYKQRLLSRDILELTNTRQESVREINIRFPTRSNETGEALAYFQKTLSGEVFEGDASADLPEIFRRLGGHPSPVMICSSVQSENWNAETQKAARDFVEFFNRVAPEVRSATPIIACLFFTYDPEESSDWENPIEADKSYWSWLSDRIFASGKKSIEIRSRKKQIQAFFSELSGEFKAEIYQNLCGVVLTELSPVMKSDVETFLDTSKIFRFCRSHEPFYCRPDGIIKVKSNVADLYKVRAVPQKIDNKNVMAIPMKTLNDELSKFLEQNCCHKQR